MSAGDGDQLSVPLQPAAISSSLPQTRTTEELQAVESRLAQLSSDRAQLGEPPLDPAALALWNAKRQLIADKEAAERELKEERLREKRELKAAAAVRKNVTLVGSLFDTSPFGSSSKLYAQLTENDLKRILDNAGSPGLSASADGSEPLLPPSAISTLADGGTYYLVPWDSRGLEVQVEDLIRNRENGDKALEYECRDSLVTELSKSHVNVRPWCDEEIVLERSGGKVKRQIDIIVECDECICIGEVGSVLTPDKELQLRSAMEFLRMLREEPDVGLRYPRVAMWENKEMRGALCGNQIKVYGDKKGLETASEMEHRWRREFIVLKPSGNAMSSHAKCQGADGSVLGSPGE